MQDFETAVRKTESEIEAAQKQAQAITTAFVGADLAKSDTLAIDIENATLAQVDAHAESMNGNIADLIISLDEVTAGFSKEFSSMRDKTGWETVVGWFSSARAIQPVLTLV